MTTYFTPVIESSNYINFFHATLPSNIRDRAWDNVYLIQDDVVKLSRDTGPTQLELTHRPGYKTTDSVAVLTVAIYCAMNSLNDLLERQSLEAHKEFIKKQIKFKVPFPKDPELEVYLSAYLVKKTQTEIDRAIGKISKGYSINGFNEIIDTVTNARRRLEFVSFMSLTIGPFEKKRRLDIGTDLLKTIEEAIIQAKVINDKIDWIRYTVEVIKKAFNERLQRAPLTIYPDYLTTLNQIGSAVAESEQVYEDLDYKNLIKQAKNFIALTPTA